MQEVNRVFLQCCFATFTLIKDLNTSSTSAQLHAVSIPEQSTLSSIVLLSAAWTEAAELQPTKKVNLLTQVWEPGHPSNRLLPYLVNPSSPITSTHPSSVYLTPLLLNRYRISPITLSSPISLISSPPPSSSLIGNRAPETSTTYCRLFSFNYNY